MNYNIEERMMRHTANMFDRIVGPPIEPPEDNHVHDVDFDSVRLMDRMIPGDPDVKDPNDVIAFNCNECDDSGYFNLGVVLAETGDNLEWM